jgi:WS/DGAT/MGAT family acyltransferase
MPEPRRLTDTEALLWSFEDDPALRSSFVSITLLEGPPDFPTFRARVGRAVTAIPALHQRVVAGGLDALAPRWEPDPRFDLDVHARHVALPGPGSRAQLLELAALIAEDPFDHDHPLWQFTVVEGLEQGQAALIAKMHHVLSDGIGAVRMSAAFLDLSPDGEEMPPVGSARHDQEPDRGWSGTAAGVVAVGRALAAAPRAAAHVAGTALRPQTVLHRTADAVAVARSLARQVAVVDGARSPLWAGRRSFRHRFETLSMDLDSVRSVAKALGGTVNDVFVTAVAGAAGAYHDAKGAPVDELRLSMPVSTRHDRTVGGNSWAPTRVLVPAGQRDPALRFRAVHERLAATKREPSLGIAAAFAGVVRVLPPPLLLRVARQQVSTVDFACSNVRGAPFDLWIGGARVLANYPMGPTAGTAFNATVLSYRDSLDLGLSVDTGAVDDAVLLRELIDEAVAELAATAR